MGIHFSPMFDSIIGNSTCSVCPSQQIEQFIEQNQSEIEDHPMSEQWFRQWSRGVCEFQGLEPGTSEFDECQKRMVGDVIEGASPVRATAQKAAVRAMSALSE